VISALRPQTYARSIVEPQAAAWLLLLRNFKPLATPDSLYPIFANLPAGALQQSGDAPLSVTAILAGQDDDGLGKSIFVFALCRLIALRAAWLLHQLARSPLTDALFTGIVDRTTPPLRA